MSRWILFVVLSLAAGGDARGQGDSDIRVMSAAAVWSENGRPLTRGDQLRPTSVVVGNGRGDLVLSCGDKGLLVATCSGGSCRLAVCAASGDNVVVRRFQFREAGVFSTLTFVSGFAKSLLTRQPKEPIIAAARAGGNPSDAVVAVDAKGVHLGPVLTRVLEGSHCFFIHTLPAGQLAATLSLNWDRVLDAEGITSAPGLSSGLYELTKGKPGTGASCERDPEMVPVWILVVSSADFERANGAWRQQTTEFAELERAGVSGPALSSIRHGLLATLAESVGAR